MRQANERDNGVWEEGYTSLVRTRSSAQYSNVYFPSICMYCRFDVFSFQRPATSPSPSSTPPKEDSAGLFSSAASLRQIIHAEIREHGIEANRIVLGGFSQGAALSYLTGLTWSAHSGSDSGTKSNLAGLVMLSGRFMFTAREKAKEVSSGLRAPVIVLTLTPGNS
jgi:predicted esterase